jgi:hypothetical protein
MFFKLRISQFDFEPLPIRIMGAGRIKGGTPLDSTKARRPSARQKLPGLDSTTEVKHLGATGRSNIGDPRERLGSGKNLTKNERLNELITLKVRWK